MSKLFNPDNSFFSIVNKVIDTLWLGLLWLILGPGVGFAGFLIAVYVGGGNIVFYAFLIAGIFLLGPGSCALYYGIVKVVRRSRGYATKEFFRSFKENISVAGITSLIVFVYGYLMVLDFQYALFMREQGNAMGNLMLGVAIAGTIIGLLTSVWIFPILSRFTYNVSGLLKCSVYTAGKHIVRTVLLVLIWIAIGLLCYVFFDYLLYYIVLVPLVPGALAFSRSFIIEPVFKKYVEQSDPDSQESEDPENTAWYRE